MKKLLEKKVYRRELIKFCGVGTATFAISRFAKRVSAADKVVSTKRLAMVIDLRKCTGCHSCSVSCKSEFGVPLGVYRSWVEIREEGKYPLVRRTFTPRLCNHCKNPPCIKVCPVKATFIREDGAVVIDEDICIGCKACVSACPYNSRFANPVKRTADKCDFCIHRVENGIVPSCVNACPSNTRIFGDLNDPNSTVSKLLARHTAQVLKPELGAEPQVYYILP